MNTQLSPKDWDALSAYLDNALSDRERKRLEARLRARADLRAALDELQQTRLVLRSAPRLRVPRNFTLTPAIAGLRPVRPGLYAAFRLAFTMASILLALVIAGDFLTGTPRSIALLDSTPVAENLAVEQTTDEEVGIVGEPTAGAAEAEPPVETIEKAVEVEPPLENAAPEVAVDAGPSATGDVEGEAQDAVRTTALPTQVLAVGEATVTEKAAGSVDTPASDAPTPTPETVAESPMEQPDDTPAEGGSPWRLLQVLFGSIVLVSGLVMFYLRRRV
ncbi:MAG: hypothetical protein ACE5GO_11895 [Anaerolineales bacterium]